MGAGTALEQTETPAVQVPIQTDRDCAYLLINCIYKQSTCYSCYGTLYMEEKMTLLKMWKNRLNVTQLKWAFIFGLSLGVAAIIAPNSAVPGYLVLYGIPLLMKALPGWPIALAMLFVSPLALLAWFLPGHPNGEISASLFVILLSWLVPTLTACSTALMGTAFVAVGWSTWHPGGMGLLVGAQLSTIAVPLLIFGVMLCWTQQGVSERQPGFEPLKY